MNKIRSTEANVGVAYAARSENLLEWLYQLRDRQRQHQRQGAWLIKGRDLPWENNRQGKMKWFLHPALDNTSIRSMIKIVCPVSRYSIVPPRQFLGLVTSGRIKNCSIGSKTLSGSRISSNAPAITTSSKYLPA